jgi:hypothetical protein
MTNISPPPLDSDGDGKADNADKVDGKHDGEIDAASYKGNDLDADGNGIVDEADHATTADSATTADDADTVDGQHAADIGKSTDEVQTDSLIHSQGFAPGFGG